MTIQFSVPTGQGLKLTERCCDRDAFATAIRNRDAEALARHLSGCPACRKVALDGVRALASQGIPFQPPESLKKVATNLAKSIPEPEEIDRVTVTVVNRKISRVNPAIEIFGKKSGARWRIAGEGLASEIRAEVELEGVCFLMRLTPLGKSGAVVTVARDGKTLGEPRKLEGTIFWPALPYGRYAVRVIGKHGEKCFLLDVAGL